MTGPKAGIYDEARRILSANVPEGAALVDATTTTVPGGYSLKIGDALLPAARGAGPVSYNKYGLTTPSVTPRIGSPITGQRAGRAQVLLVQVDGAATPKKIGAVQPGDQLIVADPTTGALDKRVPGKDVGWIVGISREAYTNSSSSPKEIAADVHNQYIEVRDRIEGFSRAMTANVTRYLTRDGTEATADEVIFTADRDGTLRDFMIFWEAAGGAAGIVQVKVRIKAPGGAWATAQVGATPADWALSMTGGTDVQKLDEANTLAILKGTKVGFQSIRDAVIANVTQLQARVTFF